jgi:hypothetical protein
MTTAEDRKVEPLDLAELGLDTEAVTEQLRIRQELLAENAALFDRMEAVSREHGRLERELEIRAEVRREVVLAVAEQRAKIRKRIEEDLPENGVQMAHEWLKDL